jgi:hypothetical protein
MNIVRKGFTVELHGKCTTEYDILQMFRFGYSIDGISKRFAEDNKMKKTEADKYVSNILYKNAMKR